MSSYLRNSILATLVYYDVFDYPLTLLETYKYLINPGRISMIAGGIGEIKMSEISGELDRLAGSGTIGHKNGFYFLNGRDEIYGLRIEKQKIADRKWKKFLKMVKLLALAPYLRGVFASGSMAINNTDEESDFDVLIIAKSGRLYTCRFFLWLISSLSGTRRKKHEKTAPDKLCFNHYISDGNLYIPHESIFNAQTYINLKPVMIKPELTDKFYSANLWLNNYAYNFRPQKDWTRRNIKSPVIYGFIAGIAGFLLDISFGNKIEKILRNLQQKKIKSDPATYEPGGRVVFTDRELEFHPRSFERIVLDRYKTNLAKLGVISHLNEKDSGLVA